MTCVCCRRQGGNLIKFELRDIKAPWLSKRSSMVVPSLVYPSEDQLKAHFRCRMLQKRRAMFWCDLKCDLCFTKSILADWLGGAAPLFPFQVWNMSKIIKNMMLITSKWSVGSLSMGPSSFRFPINGLRVNDMEVVCPGECVVQALLYHFLGLVRWFAG